MDARNLLSLSGVLLVLGSAGYYWGLGQSSHPLLATDSPALPDYQASDVESWQTAPDGQLERHLQASTVTHFREPGRALLDKPVMLIYRNGQATWQVTADRGIAMDSTRDVQLDDGVHGNRIDPAAAPVQLDTDTINVHPDQQTLDTEAMVTVRTSQGQISSRGLDANLKADTLNMHSEVQGTYAAHP